MDKWYEVPGKAGTNVIYSRVRLVRNLKEYPFPGRLTKEQSAELSEKLLGGLTGIASMDRMQYRFTHLERMGDLEKTALLERRAINRSVIKKKDPTGMILSEDESTAILLNGDDHVRIQTLQTGLTLEQLYERADKIDFKELLDEKIGYPTPISYEDWIEKNHYEKIRPADTKWLYRQEQGYIESMKNITLKELADQRITEFTDSLKKYML